MQVLSEKQQLDYLFCHHQLYAELGLYTALPGYAAKYTDHLSAYRDSLLARLDPQSEDALLLEAAKLQDQGKFDESRED